MKKTDKDTQIAKFLEAAREHGCEDTGAYDALLKKVAEQPPRKNEKADKPQN